MCNTNNNSTVFSLPDDQFAASPWAAFMEPGTCEFHKFHKIPKKDRTGKVRTPRQERISTHGIEKEPPAPQRAPIHKWSMASMVWNVSPAQLGLAAWLCSLPAPARLLISWTWETGKSPQFHSNSWNHQHYQHPSPAKSKTQQLLGGKLTIPA